MSFATELTARFTLVRRIKCDETQPCCLRCSSTGRACSYAPDPLASQSASFLTRLGERPCCEPRNALIGRNPNPSAFRDRREARFQQFFVEKTAVQLTSFFPEELWTTQALQLAHSESSIQHALVALASIHERFTTNRLSRERTEESEFSLRHYNLAINALLENRAKTASRIYVNLVSCLIFITIEVLVLRDCEASTVGLVKYGHGLAQELRQEEADDFLTPDILNQVESIEMLLLRLTCQMSELFGVDAPNIPLRIIQDADLTKLTTGSEICPLAFSSLKDAHSKISLLVAEFFKFLLPNYNGDVGMYRTAIELCAAGLDRFVRANEAFFTAADVRTVNLLEAYIGHTQTCLAGVMAADDAERLFIWDNHLNLFIRIIDAAAAVLGCDPAALISSVDEIGFTSLASPLNPPPPMVFNMELGTAMVLVSVATICRDPVVRRQAIQLLRFAPTKEGMFNSVVAGAVMERHVELEEKLAGVLVRCASDVPGEARLRIWNLEVDSDNRRAMVTFHGEIMPPETGWDEIVTW